MSSTRSAMAAAMVVGLAAVAGCSSGSSGGTPAAAPTPSVQHHHTATPTPTPTVTPSAVHVTETVTASPSSTASPTTTPSVGAENLDATPAVKKKLVKAGAASHDLPASDYTGLVPGETYYGYDASTATYWAGAGLAPSSSSEPAQISVQDDGSYLVFKRSATGSWTAYNVGLAGIAGATCPVTVPAALLAIWHWKPGSCRPPS